MNGAASLGDRFLSCLPIAESLMALADLSQASQPYLLMLGGTAQSIV